MAKSTKSKPRTTRNATTKNAASKGGLKRVVRAAASPKASAKQRPATSAPAKLYKPTPDTKRVSSGKKGMSKKGMKKNPGLSEHPERILVLSTKKEQVLGVDANFLGLEPEASSYEKSRIVILSAPYEKTVSYGGGTKLGPAAIIDASHYVEFFDDEFQRELCFECGIATLPPINFTAVGSGMLKELQLAVSKLLKDGKFVVTLGGEHSISTAPIMAHAAVYPEMSILHFDAHSDLRQEYGGTPYSHASFMARVADAGFPMKRVVQVGIRAQSIDEWRFAKQHGVETFYASAIRRRDHGKKWQKAVVEALPTEDVYVTFDVDYFDPSIMPTTGTPEPDGFFWAETMEIFRRLQKAGKRIVGFDVVELSPKTEQQHATYLVAKLVYRMLNFAIAQQSR